MYAIQKRTPATRWVKVWESIYGADAAANLATMVETADPGVEYKLTYTEIKKAPKGKGRKVLPAAGFGMTRFPGI